MLVVDLTKWILEYFLGGVQEISANDANELRLELSNRVDDNCLLNLSMPDREIAGSIVRNAVPAMLVTRPFWELCCFAMLQSEQDLLGAIRQTTHAISRLSWIARSANIATLSIDDEEPLSRLATRIGVFLGLPLCERDLGSVLSTHFPDWETITVERAVLVHVSGAQAANDAQVKLLPHEKKLLAAMDASYLSLLRQNEEVYRLTWPLEAVFNAEPPYTSLSGPIDLLGPARILTFGPYFHLPEGTWTAEVTFSLTENYSGNTFMVDIYTNADEILAVSKGDLPAGGTFKTRLSFLVSSSDERLELRTFILLGAIEGRIEILSITLQSEPN